MKSRYGKAGQAGSGIRNILLSAVRHNLERYSEQPETGIPRFYELFRTHLDIEYL